ncbi:MAG: CoA ester lyase [Chthonomonadaceae bacterium]|nr:CoA ester lyase [Chthonomonadaceae bacterium]
MRTRPLRSLLFVPGDDARKADKALGLGADTVVLDLEDAVAAARKDDALAQVAERVATAGDARACPDAPGLLAVRVNALPSGRTERELAAIVGPGLDAVLLPKVEAAADLVRLDGMLGALEARAGMGQGSVRVLALVETVRGVAACEEIAAAAHDRLLTIAFGSADFTTDARLGPGAGSEALLYARSRVVVAARVAGLPAPLDGPHLALGDEDALRSDCRRSHDLGFGGRVVIHPAQLAPVHEVYGGGGDAEQRARAKRIVEAFEAALAEGRASIRVGGEFVDEPMYRRAVAILRGNCA